MSAGYTHALGRDFSALMRALDFDASTYAASHADTAELSPKDAFQHYLDWGFDEGRPATFSISYTEVLARLGWMNIDPSLHGRLSRDAATASVKNFQRFEANASIGAVAELLAPSPTLKPILVVGDSHSHFYFQSGHYLNRNLLPIPILCSGGSAQGLANLNSSSGYGQKILALLEGLGPSLRSIPVLLKFGQVDLEFVFDFKRIRRCCQAFYPQEMQRYQDEVLDAYIGFLTEAQARSSGEIIACSIFPPTLNDAILRAGYINAQIGYLHDEDAFERLKVSLAALEHPSLAERTEWHQAFNLGLAQRCARHGIRFLSHFDQFLGEDGLVGARYIASHGGTDHHLDFMAPDTQQVVLRVCEELWALHPPSSPREHME